MRALKALGLVVAMVLLACVFNVGIKLVFLNTLGANVTNNAMISPLVLLEWGMLVLALAAVLVKVLPVPVKIEKWLWVLPLLAFSHVGLIYLDEVVQPKLMCQHLEREADPAKQAIYQGSPLKAECAKGGFNDTLAVKMVALKMILVVLTALTFQLALMINLRLLAGLGRYKPLTAAVAMAGLVALLSMVAQLYTVLAWLGALKVMYLKILPIYYAVWGFGFALPMLLMTCAGTVALLVNAALLMRHLLRRFHTIHDKGVA